MNSKLENKKILIIGGSTGIGLAVAKQACKLGAHVIIASRTAASKHDELITAVGHDIETHAFDVASGSETMAALDQIGNIDHLVITTRDESAPAAFTDTDIKQARHAFEIKFWGPYQLIQKAHGRINPHGSIILTSGIAGEVIYKNLSTMAMINTATEILCRCLAIELAPIRVNAVSPGFVSPKSRDVEKYAEQFPVGRLATPGEIASAYIHLMESAYLTGTTLVIDGGARLIHG